MMEVQAGTVVVFGDIGCPWAHVAVHRLHATRRALALEQVVTFELRAFPLELINRQPTPFNILMAEIPVAGAVEPDAGWQMWRRPLHAWPVTTIPAMEAVHAAKEQSPKAAEALDRALRRAFFSDSRCISIVPEILRVASNCDGVDPGKLEDALYRGTARHRIVEDLEIAQTDVVQGSPHLFLPDGSDVHNPGIEMHWQGDKGSGFPVVDADDRSVYEDLLQRAVGE